MSSDKEQRLYKTFKKQLNCYFYLKFWFSYWFAYPYLTFLAESGSIRASDFFEAFNYILEMKDQVKLKLSLRYLSQVYHSMELKTDFAGSQGHDYVGYKTIKGI